jgi:hypothetical protein
VVRPAIPAAPPIRRAPIAKICVVAAILTAGLVSVGAIVGDRTCPSTSATGCTPVFLVILSFPLLVVIVAACTIAKADRGIGIAARVWLSAAVAAGFGGGLLLLQVLEGTHLDSLLLIPVVVLILGPFPFVVVTVVSWVFEARAAFGRRKTPARPDSPDWV